jgi:hypothetical protein
MSTYGAMQTRIADELARSDLTTQIQYAILDAIKAYESEEFWFNRLYRSTASISLSEMSMTLPGNVLAIDKITLVRDSTTEDYLIARDAKFILEVQSPGTTTRQPKEFAIYGDRILFDCQSDDDYTIYINGTEKATAPSAAGDTSAWFVEAEELIRNRAKANIYLDVIMDADNYTKCKQREREAFDYLKAKSNVRGSGKVRPTWF